jgi:hypothetical protein
MSPAGPQNGGEEGRNNQRQGKRTCQRSHGAAVLLSTRV